jgi:ankyrin repeat protein
MEADVNAPEARKEGYTALQGAARCGRIDMIKLILNAGVDITSKLGCDQLERALEYAVAYGHNAAAKFLECHCHRI